MNEFQVFITTKFAEKPTEDQVITLADELDEYGVSVTGSRSARVLMVAMIINSSGFAAALNKAITEYSRAIHRTELPVKHITSIEIRYIPEEDHAR